MTEFQRLCVKRALVLHKDPSSARKADPSEVAVLTANNPWAPVPGLDAAMLKIGTALIISWVYPDSMNRRYYALYVLGTLDLPILADFCWGPAAPWWLIVADPKGTL